MPVIVHSGHPRQGKSYSAVAHQIIPQLVAGRRVVTNIEGMGSGERQSKLWQLVEKAGGTVDPDKFVFVKHSALEGGLIFPRDTGQETDDGIRIFDDTRSILKFGDFLIWDEARLFKTGKLPDIFADALDYHGHWARDGFNTDLLLITPGWENLAPAIRRIAEVVYLFDKHAGGKAFTRYFFKTPGNVELKAGPTALDRQTFKYDADVFDCYATNMDPDSSAKDTVVVPLWKQPRFWRGVGVALGVVLLSVIAVTIIIRAFAGSSKSEKPAAATTSAAIGGAVAPPAVGAPFAAFGAAAAPVDMTPHVVGVYPDAHGARVAIVQVGAQFQHIRVEGRTGVRFKGEWLLWPDDY